MVHNADCQRNTIEKNIFDNSFRKHIGNEKNDKAISAKDIRLDENNRQRGDEISERTQSLEFDQRLGL